MRYTNCFGADIWALLAGEWKFQLAGAADINQLLNALYVLGSGEGLWVLLIVNIFEISITLFQNLLLPM
jgi:hypothetical protein